jgi:hypothetical protein
MLSLLKDAGFDPRRIKHFNLRDNAPALVSHVPIAGSVSRAVRQSNAGALGARLWPDAVRLVPVPCDLHIHSPSSSQIVGRGATLMIEAGKSHEGKQPQKSTKGPRVHSWAFFAFVLFFPSWQGPAHDNFMTMSARVAI